MVEPILLYESSAVITYVPGVQAELPPTFVEYEKVPLLASDTVWASRSVFDPCIST